MEEIAQFIALKLGEPVQKIYLALEFLGIIERIAEPKLHWQVTEKGKDIVDNESIEDLTALVDEALDAKPTGSKRRKYPSKKTCKKCRVSRTILDFDVSRKTEDGLTKQCKSCNDQYRQEQHYGNF